MDAKAPNPPLSPEVAAQAEAKQALINYCLLQRGGQSPDRVIAFANEEKRLRADLNNLRERAEASQPEAAATAGGR